MPRRFAVRARGSLYVTRPHNNVVGVSILDFKHLTRHIFRRAKGRERPVLSSRKGGLILHGVTKGCRSRLAILGNGLGGRKCVDRIGSIVSRFARCKVSFRRLSSFVRKLGSRDCLCCGLGSVHGMCRKFRSCLHSGCVAGRRLLSILDRGITRTGVLGSDIVTVSKFAKFAPIRGQLVKRLLGIYSGVVLAIRVSQERSPFICGRPCRLFTLDGRVIASLARITRRIGIRVSRPI